MNKLFATIVVATLSFSAQAQIKHFLVDQWFENGSHMCKYDNGTVLNVGAKLCPLSI